MFKITHQGIFIFVTVLTFYLLYKLAPILTPFILGTLLAYLTNPLVKKLVRLNISHRLSVVLVLLLFLLVFFLLILMLTPIFQKQIELLIDIMPQIITWVENTMLPWINQPTNMTAIKSTLSNSLPKIGWILNTMMNSGFFIIELIMNLVLTPIVFFYLLRDWDSIFNHLKVLLPKSNRAMVIKLAKECDEVLSAFFRGQFLVMLSLMIIYSLGLTIAGLNVGLTIGVFGGLLSIVPYLGSTFVIVSALVTALVQFGTWNAIIAVVVVFAIGQILEGYVLVPYLVGRRIGFHPVAVIFSILAGGTLFGFFGVLAALPVAAVIKVLLQFIREKHMIT
jgi:predicted PurR-regulated permease PerM